MRYNILNKEIYESYILTQQINYFILENKYNVLNESNDQSRLSRIKTFIKEKVDKLIEILEKLIKKIKYFFLEYIPGKFKELKDKIMKKNKEKDTEDKMFETIDINKLLDNVENIKRALYKFTGVTAPISKWDLDNCKQEYDEILSYDFNTNFKDEIDFINSIDKTKIKITYNQILNLYKNSNLIDLDFFTKECKSKEKIVKQIEADLLIANKNAQKANNADSSWFIEIFSLYSKCLTKAVQLYGNIADLYNKYTSKICWYYNKYLNSDEREKIKADYNKSLAKKDDEQVSEWIQKYKNNPKLYIEAIGNLILFGHFRQGDKMMKVAKEKGFLEEYKRDGFSDIDDKNVYMSKEYYTRQVFVFKKNPCEKRYNHIKMIYKMQNEK